MPATATQSELKRWALKQGDVLFTKDSETPDEIGIPAFAEADMPDVLCGYHLGLARPYSKLLDGAYLAEAFGSRKLAVQFARIANGVTRFGLDPWSYQSIAYPPAATTRTAGHSGVAGWGRCDNRASKTRNKHAKIVERINCRCAAYGAGAGGG